jgi:hypothetical protein
VTECFLETEITKRLLGGVPHDEARIIMLLDSTKAAGGAFESL